MHLPLLGLLGLGLLRPSVAAAPKTTTTTTVTFQISPSHMLPNPHLLPPSTHATLSAQHAALSAPLTASNALVFRNVSAGSYLVDIHCATHAFAPVRLDVLAVPHERLKQKQRKEEDADADALELQAWETFRGNDWDNVGEALPRLDGGDVFEVRLLGSKAYFAERGGFSVFGILRNPMILIGLVSMGVFIGMPYLVNNMDPDMRAEWEERQKTNPMNSLLGGGAQPGPNPMGNFDMAAYLAGSSKEEKDNGGSSTGGNKKNQGTRR